MTLKQQLNNENNDKWDWELRHKSVFGWAMLFSYSVLRRIFVWQRAANDSVTTVSGWCQNVYICHTQFHMYVWVGGGVCGCVSGGQGGVELWVGNDFFFFLVYSCFPYGTCASFFLNIVSCYCVYCFLEHVTFAICLCPDMTTYTGWLGVKHQFTYLLLFVSLNVKDAGECCKAQWVCLDQSSVQKLAVVIIKTTLPAVSYSSDIVKMAQWTRMFLLLYKFSFIHYIGI